MTRAILTIAATLLTTQVVSAQLPPEADPGRSERTREDLERSLVFYQDVLESPAYSDRVRERARADIERIRGRLTNGDFRLGDRIAISVQGEPELPDTVTVEAGPMISLPLFGEVSLRGVLRSEIQDHLTQHLSGYIREPRVRAQGLMRVSVQGAVGAPGFYVVPADILVSDALMIAGGPAANADIEGLRVNRGQLVVMDGEALQDALREGLTLDQLNMQAGDAILLPERGEGFLGNVGVVLGLLGTVALIIQFAR